MSSCNRNQNHLVHGRSTSRVIHPPGGQSSFSLGGCYGEDVQHRTTKAAPPKPSQQMYRQSSSGSINDSLDSMIDSGCNIPGLRDHYRGKMTQQQPLSNYVVARCEPVENEPPYSNRRGAPKAMSSTEYANELKRQISVRDTIRNSSRESLKNGSSSYREAENRDNYAYAQPRNTDYGNSSRPPLAARSSSGRAPPGGHSTFSLGWD